MSATKDFPLVARIAALSGEDSKAAQLAMQDFAASLRAQGLSVGGVVQDRLRDESTGRMRIVLRDLGDGAIYRISQDLGRGSVACNLDSGELAQACASVERAARKGVDLIVLSKFSKQEAERGGLCDAFRAAIYAKTPIVAAISPACLEEWAVFAGNLYRFVEPDRAALEAWWRELWPSAGAAARRAATQAPTGRS